MPFKLSPLIQHAESAKNAGSRGPLVPVVRDIMQKLGSQINNPILQNDSRLGM